MVHSLIKHLLELLGVFRDGDIARHGEIGLLHDLAPLADHAVRLKTGFFEAIEGTGHRLVLLLAELIFSNLNGVLDADLSMGITIFFTICSRFEVDHVDVDVHDVT